MQDLPREDVFDAYVKYAVFPEMVPFYFSPVVEQKDDWSFLSDSPDVIIKKQRYNKVPFICGLMDNEHGLFVPILSKAYSNFDKGFYENRFEEYIRRATEFSEEEITLIADIFKQKYFGNVKNWDDHAQTIKPLNELFSDAMFNFPAFNFTNDVVLSGNPDTNYFLPIYLPWEKLHVGSHDTGRYK
jgi:carboxylesterase type B